MPLIPVDLTSVGLQEGSYVGRITKIEYQIKVGEKWNKDGIESVPIEEMLKYPVEKQRVHLTILIPEKGENIWHDLYLMESAKGFVKDVCEAAGVPYTTAGFDSEELLNKEVGIQVILKQSAGYSARPEIAKVYKP